jgi:hypothetical protein
MKQRHITIFVVIALFGALAFAVTRIVSIDDVSSETFEVFIRNHASSHLEAQQTSSDTPLPLLISIRFPKSDSKAGLGFPDRTDVYTLASTSGQFECHAHIRRDRVCLFTFEGSAARSELRESLKDEFPKLQIL